LSPEVLSFIDYDACNGIAVTICQFHLEDIPAVVLRVLR
jgi:hypothetical protein